MFSKHAFAGGCALAVAHDFRILKNEEGVKGGQAMMCLNEVREGIFFSSG
jgi:enoyl-CoA hydratase/carnithine racemase